MADIATTMVKIPKTMKEDAIAAVKKARDFAPVFEEFVHAAIKHETERYEQEAKERAELKPTGTSKR